MDYLFKLIYFLLFCNIGLSEIPFRTTEPFLPKLNLEIDLTSINGTINPLLLSTLNVGDRFHLKFLDGTDISCLITETNIFDKKNYYFGNDVNDKNNIFGFFIDTDNKAEGAVFFKKKNIIYKMVYNEELNCYYFILQLSL